MASSGNHDTNTYASGLHFTERRALSAEEIAAIQQRAKRLLIVSMTAAFCVPLAAIAPLAAADGFPFNNLVPLFFIAGIVGMVWLGIFFRKNLRQSIALRKDSQQGFVECHLSRGEDESGNTVEHRIEMLPVSGMLWKIDGESPPWERLLEPVQVAGVPVAAGMAAEWVSPAPSDPEGAPLIYTNRRHLSATEIDEIRRHQRRLIWNGWFFLYAFDVFLLSSLWSDWRSAPVVETPELIYWAIVITLLLCAHRRPAGQLHLAWHLRSDIAAGSVVVLRSQAAEPTEQEDAAGDTGSAETLTPAFEVLPASRIFWTFNGAAAPWRTIR